jgi:hypothetical protein
MMIFEGERPMASKNEIKGNPIDWLLEEADPGVRYLALRDLLDLPKKDPSLVQARTTAHRQGPIQSILDHMEEAGYWVKPGPGYSPKYHGTTWSILLLAQLGASIQMDERIHLACNYLLEHALFPSGQFSYNGNPSGTFDCLQGNLCWALMELGCDDLRLNVALDWMARSQTGEGISPSTDKTNPQRYYAYKCGPNFTCGANYKQPCAWGAVKIMRAIGKVPENLRTPSIQQAIQVGIKFLFSVDPLTAAWPTFEDKKPSGDWWKLGFPVFYISDLLQVAEALASVGCGNDPRLASTIEWIRSKQNEDGRWMMEFDYTSKTWVNFGPKKKPNKWVTLRAMRLLKKIGTPLP